ncbi:MAG: veratrol--corrinoid protein metyltransferase [Firmicutes bacterium]|nr:veratrol--corrinoid protein metyltransferase [Bacillota bacterium]
MGKMTAKENYLCLAKGELPESIPFFNMGMPTFTEDKCTAMIGARLFESSHMSPEGGTDPWGVTYVANEETGFASIPKPNDFMLTDITKWHDIIKAPKMPERIDWEAMAEKDYEKAEIDRNKTAVMAGGGFMPFQQLMAFMGFTEGLCAMYEEPEAVKELLHFMADFYVPIIEKTLDHYKPDIYYMLDDTAAKMNPFVSLKMYRDILKPVYVKLAQPANDRGIPIQFHNCGRCEDFIDDMLDFGVVFTDPSQTTNDLLAVKEKYANKLVISGGWDWVMPKTWPIVDEEAVRQTVRDSIDSYAPGGGYAFGGGVLGRHNDPVTKEVNRWIQEEVSVYGKNYYSK